MPSISPTRKPADCARNPGLVPGACTDHQNFVLEISRGRTRYRQRPVLKDRFLIGSGPQCDLRLGDHRIPTLHSVICIDGASARLDVLVSTPPLRINGELGRSVVLSEGDRLEIDGFQLIVRKHSRMQRQRESTADCTPTRSPSWNQEDDGSREEYSDDSGQSAAELVARIEQELRMVEDFEEGRRRGAEALMQAIAQRRSSQANSPEADAAGPAPPKIDKQEVAGTVPISDAGPLTAPILSAPPQVADSSILLEISRVFQELNDFAQQLERRAAQLTEQEARYTSAAASLLAAQQKLSAQLQSLLEQMHSLQDPADPSSPNRRAVA